MMTKRQHICTKSDFDPTYHVCPQCEIGDEGDDWSDEFSFDADVDRDF